MKCAPLALAISALIAGGTALANGPPDHAGPPPGIDRPGFIDIPELIANRGRGQRGRPDFAGPPAEPTTLGMRPSFAGSGRRGAGIFTPLPGQSGASQVSHVRFAVLDEDGEPIADAAWGRMTWFWIGPRFDFVMNGHALEASSDYVLVSLPPEGDASAASWCLAEGSSNPGGHLHLLSSIELDSHLPANLDPEAVLAPEEDADAPEGVVLALAPAGQVSCEEQEEGPSLASFGDDAVPEDWLVSIRDVHYIDSDLLDDDGEEE
jgi:hypothetical protein